MAQYSTRRFHSQSPISITAIVSKACEEIGPEIKPSGQNTLSTRSTLTEISCNNQSIDEPNRFLFAQSQKPIMHAQRKREDD